MIRSAVAKFNSICMHRQRRVISMTTATTSESSMKKWKNPKQNQLLPFLLHKNCLCASGGSAHGSVYNSVLERKYSSTPFVSSGDDKKKTVSITYVEAKDGTSKTVDAEIGMDLMNVAHENDIDLEGACGGELACSTCHLIFQKDIYDTLPEMEEEEVDMLDLALEVTDTSRLGCQILVREDFDGMTVTIPDDGF